MDVIALLENNDATIFAELIQSFDLIDQIHDAGFLVIPIDEVWEAFLKHYDITLDQFITSENAKSIIKSHILGPNDMFENDDIKLLYDLNYKTEHKSITLEFVNGINLRKFEPSNDDDEEPEYGTKNDAKTDGNVDHYRECLDLAKKKTMKLCPEGYCTAKEKYEVYPSAYANGYASQVCKGTKPDFEGNFKNSYQEQGKEKDPDSSLSRWFDEKWVNVCKKNKKGEYVSCGRKKFDPEDYPYCRPLNKLKGTTVKSVGELSQDELQQMCEEKQSLPQGINGKPTKVYLKK